MSKVRIFIEDFLSKVHMPSIRITDIVEIIIIAFVIYEILVWVKNTKAWALFKGLIVILGFIFIAVIFNMNTILWVAKNCLSVAVIAIVVVIQPELRKALEQLGKKNIFSSILSSDSKKEGRFSDHTIDEIVKAAFAMGREKTGALMVFERSDNLQEYVKTGISIDSIVSSQLLINIFEHNTPLHDGAVILSDNRIVSATCYLPLSDNRSLSKALGTRHRAGVGISEVSDSLTVIVSEESGKVSVAYGGELYNGLNQEGLREKLEMIQDKPEEEAKKVFINIDKKDRKDKDFGTKEFKQSQANIKKNKENIKKKNNKRYNKEVKERKMAVTNHSSFMEEVENIKKMKEAADKNSSFDKKSNTIKDGDTKEIDTKEINKKLNSDK